MTDWNKMDAIRTCDEVIRPGDLYIAERNTGPHLLTCKEVRNGYLIPEENSAYHYELADCKKVQE